MVHAVTDTDDFKNQVNPWNLRPISSELISACCGWGETGGCWLFCNLVITSYFVNMKSCNNAIRCGPCKMIAPVLEELNKTLEDVVFIKVFSWSSNLKGWSDAQLQCQVDVDDIEEVAAEYKITAMPTFIFIKKSEQVSLCRYWMILSFLKTFLLNWTTSWCPNVLSTGCRIEGS